MIALEIAMEEETQRCIMGRFGEGDLMGKGLRDNGDAQAADGWMSGMVLLVPRVSLMAIPGVNVPENPESFAILSNCAIWCDANLSCLRWRKWTWWVRGLLNFSICVSAVWRYLPSSWRNVHTLWILTSQRSISLGARQSLKYRYMALWPAGVAHGCCEISCRVSRRRSNSERNVDLTTSCQRMMQRGGMRAEAAAL